MASSGERTPPRARSPLQQGASPPLSPSRAWAYSPLRADQIRWFWLRTPTYSAAAARVDAPRLGTAVRFCEADSQALEEGYRRREEELEGAWWVEAAAAACAAEAPGKSGKSGGGSRRGTTGDSEASDSANDANGAAAGGGDEEQRRQQGDLDVDDDEDPFAADAAGPSTWADYHQGPRSRRPPPPPGVLVRAGDWEVDLRRRRMSACYHPAPAHRVRRGSWFLEMSGGGSGGSGGSSGGVGGQRAASLSSAQPAGFVVPLSEALSDELETAYRTAPWRRRGGMVSLLGGGSGTAAAGGGGAGITSAGNSVPLSSAASDLKGSSSSSSSPARAVFLSPDDIFLCRPSSSSSWSLGGGGGGGGGDITWATGDSSSSGSSSSFIPPAGGMRLFRGYPHQGFGKKAPSSDPSVDARDEAWAAAAAAAGPPAAVVFAVHGVGQTLASSNIADDAAALARSLASAVLDEPSGVDEGNGGSGGGSGGSVGGGRGGGIGGGSGGAASKSSSPQRTPPRGNSPTRSRAGAAAGGRDRPVPPPPPPPPRHSIGSPGGAGRIAVLPVQWRKHLALDVDAVAAGCAPAGSAAIRGTLHATAVEVLLYLAPAHARDMTRSLVASLNAQWARFSARHPDFAGSVHVVAHSLGSLLVYDVLCQQPGLMRRLAERGVVVGEAGLDLTSGSRGGSDPSSASFSSSSRLHSHPVAATTPDLDDDDLLDLGGVFRPGSTPEERRLRAENEALRRQLEEALGGGRESGGRGGALDDDATGGGDASAAATAPPPPLAAASAGEPGGDAAGAAVAMASVPPVDFDVDNFICIGSPLGLFLALRQVNPSAGRGLGTPGAAALMPGAWALSQSAGPSAGAARSGGGAAATSPSTSTALSLPAPASSKPRRRVYYDGLPACRRLYNLYHPFDPIAYRVEPLAASFPGGPSAAPRAVFAARAGGSRLHVGLREAAEDVGGALASGAAALGGALAAGIRSLRTAGAIAAMAVGGRGGSGGGGGGGGNNNNGNNNNGNDGGSGGGSADANPAPGSSSSIIRFSRVAPASERAAAAAEAAADAAALAAAERARGAGSAIERLTGGVPLTVGGGGAGSGGGGAAAKGTPPPSPPPGMTAAAAAAAAAASAPPPPPSSSSSAAAGRSARGRLDFQLQTGATENQYLSALSSHFGYWGSADVGLFVLRAVRGVDVRAGGGVPSSSASSAASSSAAAAAAGESVIAALEGAPILTSSSSSSPTRRAQQEQQQQQQQQDRRGAAA